MKFRIFSKKNFLRIRKRTTSVIRFIRSVGPKLIKGTCSINVVDSKNPPSSQMA
jgi:hypothetical protein